MKTLIIDDDPQSHKVLGNLLSRGHPDIEVETGAQSVEEGLQRIAEVKPDLVFLDVELHDRLGFELLQELKEVDFQVIFITAHNKYAISAIRFGALDFLLKPIDEEELKEALDRAQESRKEQLGRERLELLLNSYRDAQEQKLPTRFILSSQGEISYYKVEDIIRMEADQVYTKIYLKGEKSPQVSSQNLGKYIEQFAPYPDFIQTHRSHLINRAFVKKFVKSERKVIMEEGGDVPASKRYLDDFLSGMGSM